MTGQCPKLERILMSVDAVGGVWNYALEIVKGLAYKEIDIVLASMGPLVNREKRKEISKYDNVQLFESSYKLEWMDDPWQDIELASEWLLELEIMNHPDIIHLNGFVHGALPWHSPLVIVAHSCVCSWFQMVEKHPIPPYLLNYHKKVNDGLQGADYIVTPTEWMMKMMRNNYNFSCPTQVIYNGRSENKIHEYHKDNYILSAGRIWDKGKNMKMLMDAASKITWPVFIAGDYGNCDFNYENVNFLGQLDSTDMWPWIGNASIFVSTSLYEPFGLSILEAAACKCALVISEIESFRELWSDAALFVNPNDSDSLILTINELIKNEKLRIEYAQKAKKRASDFSSDNMLNNYISLYETLLKNRTTDKFD